MIHGRTPTRAISLLDAMGLGALAGVATAMIDLIWAQGPLQAPTVPPADALAVALAATGLCGLSGAVAALVVLGVARSTSRLAGAGLGSAVGGLVAVAPLVALNLPLARRLGAPGWAALVVAVVQVAVTGALLERLHRAGRGAWLAGPGLTVAVALTWLNGTLLTGLYRPQHASLALATFASLALAAHGLATRSRPVHLVGRGALGATLLALAATLVAWPVAPGANARLVLGRDTLATTHAVDLAGRLSDRDGDGYPSLLGGADCGPDDPTVHPGARDVLDDGLDQDCLGGDATRAGVDALQAARRSLADEPTPPVAGRPLIVLSVDALRADRAVGMASVQRLASRGVSFTRAYATYPSTILSFFGMLTGRAPSAIATRRVLKWDVPLPDSSQTLPEVLTAAGYQTHGLFFHHLFAPQYGITRGFQHVWTESADPAVVVWGSSSAETADRALQALAELGGAGQPFLLWVHFYDPHEPYVVHPEQPVADTSSYADLYDGEVRFTDAHLGRVVDRLLADGWPERALVVLLADHGEALGEAGRLFHNNALTDEQVRVPLIVLGAGLPPGAVRDTPVSLQDLADTLCAELGLPRPAHSQAASFRALLRREAPPEARERPVYFEVFADSGVQRGVLAGTWKLTHHLANGALELVDVARDPAELLNVVDLAPGISENLGALLSEWGAVTAASVGGPSAGDVHGDQGEADHPR